MPEATSPATDLIVRQAAPFNGGPPLPRLRQHFVAPFNLFYARSHAAVPHVEVAGYRLNVGGRVARPRSFRWRSCRGCRK